MRMYSARREEREEERRGLACTGQRATRFSHYALCLLEILTVQYGHPAQGFLAPLPPPPSLLPMNDVQERRNVLDHFAKSLGSFRSSLSKTSHRSFDLVSRRIKKKKKTDVKKNLNVQRVW